MVRVRPPAGAENFGNRVWGFSVVGDFFNFDEI